MNKDASYSRLTSPTDQLRDNRSTQMLPGIARAPYQFTTSSNKRGKSIVNMHRHFSI